MSRLKPGRHSENGSGPAMLSLDSYESDDLHFTVKEARRSKVVHEAVRNSRHTNTSKETKRSLASPQPLLGRLQKKSVGPSLSSLKNLKSYGGVSKIKIFKTPEQPQMGISPKHAGAAERKRQGAQKFRQSKNMKSPSRRSIDHLSYFSNSEGVSRSVDVGSSMDQISNLMEYLDNVESDTADQVQTISNIGSAAVASKTDDRKTNEVLNLKPLRRSLGTSIARDVFGGIKAKMTDLKQQLGEKEAECKQLRSDLKAKDKQMDDSKTKANLARKAALQSQKLEFEAALQRQLKLSDKLLKEKESLSKQYNEFAQQARESEAKFEKIMKQTKERHKSLLAKKEKMWAAAEKARREKWERERTSQIKEMTIRGLEPEIQAILKKAKEDLKKAEDRRQTSLDIQAKEHKIALEQERMRGKREGEVEAEQRLRHAKDEADARVREEKSRMEKQILEEKNRMQQTLLDERQRSGDAAIQKGEEFRKQFGDEQRRHAAELEAVRRRAESDRAKDKARLQIEKEQWQKAILAKLNKQAKQREKILVQKLRQQQEKELEVVIKRLSESQVSGERKASKTLAKEAEKYKKIAQEKTKELERWMGKGLEASEGVKGLRKEVSSLRSQLAANKVEKVEHEAVVKSLHKRVADLSHGQRHEEEALLKKLERTSERAADLEAKLGENSRAYAAELQRVQVEADHRTKSEVAKLHNMVKKAIEKKDTVIQNLTAKLEDLEARNREVEQAFNDVRNEL